MDKLLEGVRLFHESYYKPRRELFEKLSAGQQPSTLFITCSDSRIDPGLLTQTRPGELFVVRNAGNIVPRYGANGGGECATIEYAVAALGVSEIVVCGHTGCGAMKALLQRDSVKDLPAVDAWLEHARVPDGGGSNVENAGDADDEGRLDALIESNVLAQFENLRTHPKVAEGLAAGRLRLHGWVYRIGHGDVTVYAGEQTRFVPALGREQRQAGLGASA